MIKVKNLTTGEVSEVWYVRTVENQIVGNSRKPRKDFAEKFGMFVEQTGTTEDGFPVYTICEGYELTKQRTRKGAQPKEQEQEQPQPEQDTTPQPEQEQPAEVVVTEQETQEQPKPVVTTPIEAPSTNGLDTALSAVFAPIFANVAKQIEANIRAEVQVEIDALKAQARTHTTRIELTANGEKHEVEGIFCKDFEDLCEDVNAGYDP